MGNQVGPQTPHDGAGELAKQATRYQSSVALGSRPPGGHMIYVPCSSKYTAYLCGSDGLASYSIGEHTGTWELSAWWDKPLTVQLPSLV